MSNGNCGRQRVNLQWFSASRLLANYHYAKWCMQQFSSLNFICDNMMLLVLNEHLNASLVALATCITAGAYQGMKNLWAHWPLRSRPLGVIGMDLTLKTFPRAFTGSSSAAMSPRAESLIETFAPLAGPTPREWGNAMFIGPIWENLQLKIEKINKK